MAIGQKIGVLVATLHAPTDGIVLTNVECGGYFAIYVFWTREHRWCEASGHVYRTSPGLPPVPAPIPK